jgi:hypothetical protein
MCSVLAASAISIGAAAAPASAQQNGLVNVNVGDVTVLQDVGVGVAANVAANICGVQVNAAVIADQVVRNGQPLGVCTTGPQNAPVTITP